MKLFFALTIINIKMYFRNKQGIFWTLFFPGFIMIIFGFQSVFSVSENPQISVFISENPSNNSQQKLTEKEEILLNNISNDIKSFGIYLSSGVEKDLGIKDNYIINNFI